MDSLILNEDIKRTAEDIRLLKEFENKSILVTGATGLIGSVLIKTLMQYADDKSVDIKIFALVRSTEKAKKIFSDYINTNLIFITGDITKAIEIDEDIDYIFHLASITSSKAFVDNPVEVIKTSIYGADNMLMLAKEKKVKGFLYTSSLEIYGVPEDNNDIVVFDENKAGYINTLDVRSSYSEGKRMIENLCAAYCSEYGVPVKIARLTQTFGPGISYNDNRVFAEFARKAIENENIVIHSTGGTIRPYCYTCDAVSAIICILLKGEVGFAYNVANDNATVSIKELARSIVTASGNSIEVIIKNDIDSSMGYNPEVKIDFCTDALKKLEWESKYGFDDMINRLVRYYEEQNERVIT